MRPLWLLAPPLLATVVLPAHAADAAPPPERHADRVALHVVDDPEYARLQVDPRARLGPDSPTRLVVIREGRCVRDRGLRAERAARAIAGRPDVIEESGLFDEVVVAADGRGALLQTLRYRETVTLREAAGDDVLRGNVSLSWIVPAFPDGRWTVDLEPGRFVKEAVALSLGMGAAISTTGADGGPADFRLYSGEGRIVTTIAESQASTVGITATAAGGFVAVDLAYPPGDASATTADRGILVLDLLQGGRWTYTWRYGDDREPVAWRLDDTGILSVTVPGKVLAFDRNGRPLN